MEHGVVRLFGSTYKGELAAPATVAWPLRFGFGVFLIWAVVYLGMALFGRGTSAAEGDQIVIRQAEFIVSDASSMPPADSNWQLVPLPHRFARPDGTSLPGFWYGADFALPDIGPLSNTQMPLWLYLPNLSGGGQVYANGALIAAVQSADAATQVRLYRPFLFLLPPSVLRAGTNRITLHFASREPRISVGTFEIGPEHVLRGRFEQRLFVESTTAKISAAACLMAGSAVLVFWLRRREERLYGLFALSLLFWSLRTLLMRWPVVPIAYLTEWRLAYYVCQGGFVVAISICTLNFSQIRRPRLERFMLGYAVAGCIAFAVIGMPLRPVMDSYWILGFFPATMYCIAHLTVWAAHQRTRSSLAMGLAMLLALALCMHDFAVQEGWFHLTEIYLMHLGIPVFMLVMAGVLSDRFIDALQTVESVNERLALRIDERERDLALSYERVSQLERVYGATEERQRIMRDMHDGIGSQLLTTMAIVERGSASRADTVALLQECLDDMCLATDSLTPAEPDLMPALESFRIRMRARFGDAGISLHWQEHDIPESLALDTHAGLQVLRILQEALANVLKHARASNVTVDLNFAAHRLLIRVSDDGIGSAKVGTTGGRGLLNMQTRAARIGAHLTIDHQATGTSLALAIPCVS